MTFGNTTIGLRLVQTSQDNEGNIMAEQAEVDVTKYLEKEATPVQARFADYLQEVVGYNPNAAKTKLEAFQEGVRLATVLRMIFQASDYNRSARAAEQAAAGKETDAPAPPRKSAPAAKATKAAKAPAAKAAPAAKTAPPTKAAKTTRRRAGAAAPATAAADPGDAPF